MAAGKQVKKVGPMETLAPASGRPSKLMVRGSFRLSAGTATVELVRGMSVCTQDGRPVGKVAAVMVDPIAGGVTHMLLCRLPQVWDYRVVPVHLILQVEDETVFLDIPETVVETLQRKERVP